MYVGHRRNVIVNPRGIATMMDGNQLLAGSFGDNDATLIIYSPTAVPDQVVRPYTYKFGAGLANAVMDQDTNRMLSPSSAKNQSNDVLTSIVPDANGIQMNTGIFQDRWSFILIINHQSLGRQYRAGCGSRMITTGYFIDEPMAPTTMFNTTPVLNPNATMVFTHTSGMNATLSRGPNGDIPLRTTTMDVDHVDVTASQLFSEAMYLNTPGDVDSATMRMNDTGNLMVTPGAIALQSLQGGSAKIASRLKSPIHQMQEIFHTFNTAITHSEQMDNANLATPLSFKSPEDIMRDTIRGNLPGSNSGCGVNMSYILDTTQPMFLGKLIQTFQNIQVFPFKIPTTTQWDVYPQTIVDIKTTMSSLVSSTLTFVAQQLWISSISFRYNSWMGGATFGANMHPSVALSPEVWEFYECSKLVPAEAEELKATVEGFKRSLEWQLFPIIQAVGGHFDLMCQVDVWGNTLIDLRFMDNGDQGDGFITTNNKLGGYIAPTIGTMSTVNHNAQQLASLTETACGIASHRRNPMVMPY